MMTKEQQELMEHLQRRVVTAERTVRNQEISLLHKELAVANVQQELRQHKRAIEEHNDKYWRKRGKIKV